MTIARLACMFASITLIAGSLIYSRNLLALSYIGGAFVFMGLTFAPQLVLARRGSTAELALPPIAARSIVIGACWSLVALLLQIVLK